MLCPAGTYTALASTNCTACQPATYSTTLGAPLPSTCLDCPLGTYSPFYNASACLTCPTDAYSNAHATACLTCPAYSHSPGGTDLTGCLCEPGFQYALVTNPFSCWECLPGTWSYVNSPACSQCPAGTASPYYRATDPSTCAPCLAGSYSLSANPYCTLCPAGKFASAASLSTCAACTPGYYALLNASACVACQPGQYSSGQQAGQPCPACAPGTYSPLQAATACLECRGGRYVPLDAEDQCLPCAQDTFSENRSYACYPCPDHSHSPGDTPASGCACDAGYYPFYRCVHGRSASFRRATWQSRVSLFYSLHFYPIPYGPLALRTVPFLPKRANQRATSTSQISYRLMPQNTSKRSSCHTHIPNYRQLLPAHPNLP